MSDLAAYAAGAGTGLVMMAVVYYKLRHELAAGWRSFFEEPGETAINEPGSGGGSTAPGPADPVDAPGRTRLAFAFHLLATLTVLVVGLLQGQVFLLALGVIGLISSVVFVWAERRRSSSRRRAEN